MKTPETTPVILGVGEFIDRPIDAIKSLEPVDLMARALQAADTDAGGGLLAQAESIELIGIVSWRYSDPVTLLCQRLGIDPARKTNASMGGDTPIRLIHEAAVRIARGEQRVAAIVGGEATYSRNKSKREKIELPWTPMVSREQAVQFPSSRFALSPVAKQLRIMEPAQIYPLYEMAVQAACGQTPAEANRASAELWARYAAIAATNESAWIRNAPNAKTIGTPAPDNRLISWPYPKLMVANPAVNMAAAIIVTSLAVAKAAGVPEGHIVHIWGGASAMEPEDFLHRDSYARSTAQEVTLQRAMALVGGDARRVDFVELYSCFPVVPKMAMQTLGLRDDEREPTVTGGLTFFGGPLNNYMSHAVAAMARKLRAAPGKMGLLYGQGGYVNKHHTLVVSTTSPPEPLKLEYSAQREADRRRGPVPPLNELYRGSATIETYTVLYARDGVPLQGVVIARNPAGERVMARVPGSDDETLAVLLATERSAVGIAGHIRIDAFGKPVWEAGSNPRDRKRVGYRYCKLEREGRLTIVTINRPEAMNAFTPATNAELAEIFDEFSADPDQWVAIITGAGDKAFSAGNDLKFLARAMARGEEPETPLAGFGGLTSRYDCRKPVIAAVNGIAMGGGFEVALACDLIIASETAVFALPEPKVGLAAFAGGLLRLPRQIGLKQAMAMILTGRRVSAAEGRVLGFVNEVVAPDKLLEVARRWADAIMANSPMSVRASKEIVHLGLEEKSIESAYQAQNHYPAVKALFRSSDLREGPLAFAEKRPPRWTGR
jgi:acetyl-CoA C-acetyltransferase